MDLAHGADPHFARRAAGAVEVPRGAVPGVVRPTPDSLPWPIRQRLLRAGTPAAFTYEALVQLAANHVDGAVFARHEAIAAKRAALGAATSARSISRHLRALEDHELLVRLESRETHPGGDKVYASLLVLLGYHAATDAMVGLSWAVCRRLAWGPHGLRAAVQEGSLNELSTIAGPYRDRTQRQKGRRRLRLDQYLPPLRRTARGDNRERSEQVIARVGAACDRVLLPWVLTHQVGHFVADLIPEGAGSEPPGSVPSGTGCSAPGGAGCRSAPGGADCRPGQDGESDPGDADGGCGDFASRRSATEGVSTAPGAGTSPGGSKPASPGPCPPEQSARQRGRTPRPSGRKTPRASARNTARVAEGAGDGR